MILKKILIENIRSYKNQEIVFPKGSTLLSGDIGTGKTSVLLAIEFALFGLQPSQKGSSLLRNGEERARVVLEFEIEDKTIIIERTLKKAKTISQDYASITINNEKFEGSITEIKTKVLNLLNYPQEFAKKTNLLYKFTVYTPQEEMKQIILEPNDLRLNTIRHVFGIDRYKRIEENSEIISFKIREKIRNNEGRFYDLESDKESLKQKKENLVLAKENNKKAEQEHKTALDFRILKEEEIQEINEKIQEKKNLENEKSKSMILSDEKKQQLINANKNIEIIKNQISEYKKITFNQSLLNSLNEQLKSTEKNENELQKELISISSSLNTLETRKKEASSLKDKLSSLKTCPTCLQEVNDSYKSNIFAKLDEELNSITRETIKNLNLKESLNDKINNNKKQKENLQKQKSEQEFLKIKIENLKEKEKNLKETEKQKESITKDIEMLDKHIKLIDSSISDYSKYDSIYIEKNKELLKAKENETQVAIKKAEINKEIQFLESQIKENEQEIKNKEQIKQKTENLKALEDWISNKFINLILFTEKNIMLALKEQFSELFSKWFSVLVSESLKARLDENFSPVIEQEDYELDYEFLSGGERTAIALAYRLSLNQVINSLISKIKTSNLVILDEPTEGFSSQQLDKMKDVLSQLKTEQLIIVSHEQKIESFVDNIIKFRKEDNLTRVE